MFVPKLDSNYLEIFGLRVSVWHAVEIIQRERSKVCHLPYPIVVDTMNPSNDLVLPEMLPSVMVKRDRLYGKARDITLEHAKAQAFSGGTLVDLEGGEIAEKMQKHLLVERRSVLNYI